MSDRQLLITRIDDTLTGDRWALRRFADWYQLNSDRIKLAYCSWRLLDEVEEFVAANSLPAPDAVIGGSGTEVHHYPSGQPVQGWARNVSDWDAGCVRDHLVHIESLPIDPNNLQSALRVRCVAPDLSTDDLRQMKRRMQKAGLRVRFVYDNQQTLDVMPEGICEGSAAAFLAHQCEFDDDKVLVSGASAADLGLFRRRFRGIVPANAHSRLRRLPSSRIHQSRLACAAGVLDGIGHFDSDHAPPVPMQTIGGAL